MNLAMDDVRVVATDFRAAMEHVALTSIGFSHFPRGACGDTAEILGRHLNDLDGTKWVLVHGVRQHLWTHAWLERESDRLHVDITGDQFGDRSAVVVAHDSSWFSQFKEFGRRRPLEFEGPALRDLMKDLDVVRSVLQRRAQAEGAR